MRTAQELFDAMVVHLRAQNAKSMRDIKGDQQVCAYRGKDGRRCAIGAIIPDEQYCSDMEGNNIGALLDDGLVGRSLANEFRAHRGLLDEMQSIHDGNNPEQWESEFAIVAKNYRLTLAPKSC